MTTSSKPKPVGLGKHLACKRYANGGDAPFITAVLRGGYDAEVKTGKDMALVFLDGDNARYRLPKEEEWRSVTAPVVFLLIRRVVCRWRR